MGAVYKIAPRDKIEREEQLSLKARRDLQELEDLKIQAFTVSYLPAPSLIAQVEPMLSPRGSVRSNDRTNSLIVKDIESRLAEVGNLLRDLDKRVLQVIIEAKIIVAQKKALQELGVSWGGAVGMENGANYLGLNGALQQATGLPDLNYGNVTVPSQNVVSIPTSKPPMGGFGFTVGKLGGYNLNMKLTALEENNDLKILSNPKLLVLDNESAVISEGKEVPYLSTTSYYTSTEFKKVELSLQVTPHITSAKSISLDVQLKNDHLSEYTVDGQPIIDTQHIHTTLLLENGETAVIGGIMQKENRKVNNGVPFLSKIPGLGWLFKGSQKSLDKRELVIFLTPEIS
jgi:type IV pilus assembly protein PilQ